MDRFRFFISSPIVTIIHWAVGVQVSPGNQETVQVTMYGSPISERCDGLDVLMLALIGCWGTVGLC